VAQAMTGAAVAWALARVATLVGPGDIINVGPSGFGVYRRQQHGRLPCRVFETLARHGHLVLQCVAVVTSASPPVTAYHFRQVAIRHRGDGACHAAPGGTVKAYVIAAPGRPPRVFVYGL